jgi:hypothetical protein
LPKSAGGKKQMLSEQKMDKGMMTLKVIGSAMLMSLAEYLTELIQEQS